MARATTLSSLGGLGLSQRRLPASLAPPSQNRCCRRRRIASSSPTSTAVRVVAIAHRRDSIRASATPPDRRDETEVKVLAVSPPQDDPSFFLEPLLRSFVLGVSAGCLFESLHVAFKFVGLAAEVGLSSVAEALPSVIDRFAPMFAGVHAVAIGSWALFYVIEAVAVVSVLKRFPDDRAAAEREVNKQVTLGKKMLPMRLAPRAALTSKREEIVSALSSSSSSSSSSSCSTSPSPSPSTSPSPSPSTSPSISSPPTSSTTEASDSTKLQATAVLEAPPAAPTAPPVSPPPPSLSRIPGAVEIPPAPKARRSIPRAPERKQQQQQEEEEEKGQASLADRRRRSGLAPGALDPSNPLARRAKELAGRRAYLKNFWYAVALSEEVKSGGKATPFGATALGRRLVLFRDGADGGRVKAISDVCPHRGAPLHKGWLTSDVGGGGLGGGGLSPSPVSSPISPSSNEKRGEQSKNHTCVVCPYHGWALDGSGVLRDVPAAEHADEWPRKQLVESYPVVEKGGFVWLFYGSPDLPEGERPPIPFVPELEDPGWKAVYGSIEFDCEHHDVFQNAIDVAHIHYLHSDSFGNQDKPEIRDMHVKADAYGATAEFGLHNKPVNSLWAWSSVPRVDVTARAMLPSTSMISFTLAGGLSFITFVNTVPISPGKAINRFALIRKLDADPTGGLVFNSSAWDGIARRAMLRILGEDKEMIEELRPQDLAREISVRADLLQTAFSKLRGEYLAMGYGVDPPSKEGDDGVGGRGGLGLRDL